MTKLLLFRSGPLSPIIIIFQVEIDSEEQVVNVFSTKLPLRVSPSSSGGLGELAQHCDVSFYFIHSQT